MTPASTLRIQIESALAHKIPSALSPAQKFLRPTAPTGVMEVDELLGGGLPLGAITEMTGVEGSGLSSLTLSHVACVTRKGSVCAWIDAGDAFHPESAAAAGVDLSRLLWVRCGVNQPAQQVKGRFFALPPEYLVAPPPSRPSLHGGGFGPHPRHETRGLSDAVDNLMNSGPQKPSHTHAQLYKQQPTPMYPAPQTEALGKNTNRRNKAGKPWSRIEQALSTADLILQNGGFSAIVLDMAGIAPEYVSRVDLSIWFRYRAAIEKTQACFLLLTQHPSAKSARELLLRFSPVETSRDESTVFTGARYGLEVERRRFAPQPSIVIPLKKPAQRQTIAYWRSHSTWAGVR